MADLTAPQPPAYGPPSHAPSAAVPPTTTASRPKTPLRDIVFGWRAALAVLVAGIVMGGLVGSAITLIADHAGGSTPAPSQVGSRFGGYGPFGQSGQGSQEAPDQTQPGTGS